MKGKIETRRGTYRDKAAWQDQIRWPHTNHEVTEEVSN